MPWRAAGANPAGRRHHDGQRAVWGRPAAEETAMVELADVQAAAGRLEGQVLPTPCLESRTLSQITGAQLFLKFENLQYTGSFKERGACNRLAQLSPAQRARGVVAMSAGNHAQGVAYHAQRLGMRAVIVMPRFTPGIKVERTRALGAEVVLHGETLEQAREHADRLAAEQGLTFVHPYDDEAVIAGQGTVALEMLRAQPQLEVLVVAAGGGGLIGGMALAAKALKPGIEVVGVQTRRFAAMVNALTGSHWPLGGNTIAEGIAVAAPGRRTLALAQRYVDDWLVVDEEDLEQAIVLLLDIEKTLVEGAGAAGLAAVLKHPARLAGRRVGLVLCGGNLDPLLLASIIERGMVRAGRLARLVISTRDLPGQLARIAAVVAEAGANIDQVHHQRAFTRLAAQNVEIELVLQTRGAQHVQEVLAALRGAGFEVALR